MIINSAEYIGSATTLSKCPKPDKAEFAFIGRSNVGKSSLINMITQKKGLAKISGSPGKTTTINHFLINQQWYLVDLPGYGFAKRSKSEREKWIKMIHSYLRGRENLMCTFVLIDARLPLQKHDEEFMQWMAVNGLPFIMLLTKSDKLSKNKLINNFEDIKGKMLASWEELPDVILTSAKSKLGKEDLLDFIENTVRLFRT